MKNAGRILMIALLWVAGCDRQIPILDMQAITGYQVQGTVTDQVGNPVPNVAVLVDYNYNLDFTDSSMTRTYFVTNNSVPTQAVAVDWDNRIVRVLTPPRQVYGPFLALWDGKDSTGIVPPSGIYYVKYLVGGTVAYSYRQLVSGGQVTSTDAHGNYTIPFQNLPIDSTLVPYFDRYDSLYVGNILLAAEISLTFTYQSRAVHLLRTVNKNQVTFVNVSF
jgi:hypothetical protein